MAWLQRDHPSGRHREGHVRRHEELLSATACLWHPRKGAIQIDLGMRTWFESAGQVLRALAHDASTPYTHQPTNQHTVRLRLNGFGPLFSTVSRPFRTVFRGLGAGFWNPGGQTEGTAKKREKTGEKWARYGLKKVGPMTE